MKKSKKSYFWTCYSDLMTSLFFVMLVLFALTTIMLKKQNDKIEKDKEKIEKDKEVTERKLEEIKRLEESTRDLEGDYFEYDSIHNKFKLKIVCNFPRGESSLNTVNQSTRDKLEKAGKEIEMFFKNHRDNDYLLIIEGQASYDNDIMSWSNYELSYRRATVLAVFWQSQCQIDLGENCELQIAGSGDGRFNPNSMREKEEVKNQRFMIYIIPKNILNKNQDL